MEPVTVIVTALALGVSAGMKETAASAVKDAYVGLKTLVTGRYRGVDLERVEEAPSSQSTRTALADDLADAGAGTDVELLHAARVLIAEVCKHDAAAAPSSGIDLAQVEATTLRVHDVESSGSGIRVRDSKFTGDIDIGRVRAGRDQLSP